MQAGFCCLESGLSRSKNSINVAVKNVVDFCIAGALFWLFGYALMFGDSLYGWIGASDFVFSDSTDSHWPTALFLFQFVFCGAAMTIASGAGRPGRRSIHSRPPRAGSASIARGARRVVTRLLNPPGGEPLLQFEVIDTGIGVAEDQIDNLFLPFTQAD